VRRLHGGEGGAGRGRGGGGHGGPGRRRRGGRARRGRAVQLDPIKPKLKAPGTKRLKLEYDYLLSSFAFKINLRRYTVAAAHVAAFMASAGSLLDAADLARPHIHSSTSHLNPSRFGRYAIL